MSVNFAVYSPAEGVFPPPPAGGREVGPMEPGRRVVGVKQSRKAIQEGRAVRVYLADDADPAVTDPIRAACAAAGIPVVAGKSMSQLGRAFGISVGASVAAELA